MYDQQAIWVGSSGDVHCNLRLKQANRHGLIAGATGTGKTVTLKVMAESFSDAGVPVFLADVKGDLAGMCRPGEDSADMQERIARFGLAEAGFRYRAYPTEFWDIFGKKGLPLRTTVSEFGPLLFSRLLELNKIQSDLLEIIFRIADEEGLLLLDMKDLKAMVRYVEDNAEIYRDTYGNIGKASTGAILRALVALEGKGGEQFFGEPALQISDWMRVDAEGRGYVNILDSTSLIQDPTIYSTFMLWMLNELFTELPEAGDLEKPKMVFFFDEAHLLFADATKEFERQVVQTVRLIRSKGVGVVFVTQTPKDIPSDVLAQLGSRIQHGLRASTPDDFKKLKATVQTFPKTSLELDEVLTTLGTGEAVVTVLDPKGNPTPVTPVGIWAPASVMGPASADTVARINQSSVIMGRYRDAVNPDSAEEKLERRAAEAQAAREEALAREAAAKEAERAQKEAEKEAERAAKEAEKAAAKEDAARQKEMEKLRRQVEKQQEAEEAARQRAAERRTRQVENVLGSVLRTAGREITRSIFGTRKR